VAIRDAELVVDEQRVDEPYVDHASIDGVYFGPVTVPAGSVFVMGDHRETSIDSRSYGPIRLGDLDGRLLLRFGPGCGG
jgi:signal peptidase I